MKNENRKIEDPFFNTLLFINFFAIFAREYKVGYGFGNLILQ